MKELLDFIEKRRADVSTEYPYDGNPIRVGIIGCGGIGRRHIEAYLTMPDVVIVAACDIVPGRAEALMTELGINAKTDYRDHAEMLADKSLCLDAVSVCTYNRQHVPCAVAALECGINVLLEKPMCVDMDEAWELYRAAKRAGRVLSVGFQPRFDDNMKDICSVVESGVLGKIYYVQTGGGRRRGIPVRDNGNSFIKDETAGTGAIGDIGCYAIDMIMNAIGHPRPLTVSGYMSDFFGKNPEYYVGREDKRELADTFSVEDFGAAFIRLQGGVIIDFRISWAMNLDTSGDTIIYGTKASLRIPSTECWNGTIGGPMKLYYNDAEGRPAEFVIPSSDRGGGNRPYIWNKKIRAFLDACKYGAPVPAPIEQIMYNQAIISGIMTSSRLGREIEIDLSEMDK